MKLSKNAVLSLEILAAHKLRTALSVLGIVVGVAAVVVMVSIGKGAEKRILDQIRAMGTNLITVSAGQTRLVAGRQRQMTTVTSLLPADAKAIAQECPLSRGCRARHRQEACYSLGNGKHQHKRSGHDARRVCGPGHRAGLWATV